MSLKTIVKICLISLFVFFIIFVGALFNEIVFYKSITTEEIMESIVIVESSSGVVVYKDDEFALVLTSAHVVENKKFITVMILTKDESGVYDLIPFLVDDLVLDKEKDLAILKVPLLDYTIIPAQFIKRGEEPKIGDDIFIASNPNRHYRSLKKGILSSKQRMTDKGVRSWEVDAMIIFGSSGGGLFTSDGKLFGIVRGIDVLQTDQCWGIIDDNGKERSSCLLLPLTEIGYIVPPDVIRDFISNSKFAEYIDL